MTAAAFPTINVSVAFTNNPFDTSPTWVDITKYVQNFTTTMGRQHELQQVNPSTAKIVLWNGPTSHGDTTGGRFSPWNTGSPYYNSGNGLVPTKPVKITATYSSTTYNIFYGYVDNWTPGYGETSSLMTLNCSDILKMLNLNTLDTGIYDSTVLGESPTAYWPCNDMPGALVFADASGNGNTADVLGVINFGSPGLSITDSETSAGVDAYGTGMMLTPLTPPGSGTIVVEGWFQTTSGSDQVLFDFPNGVTAGSLYGTQVAYGGASKAVGVFAGTGPPSARTEFIPGPVIGDGLWHQIVLQVPCGSSTAPYVLYVDGKAMPTTGVGSVGSWSYSSVGFGVVGAWQDDSGIGGGIDAYSLYNGFLAKVAYFPSLTLAQIQAHYQIGSAAWLVQDTGSRVNAVLELCGIPSGLKSIGSGVVQCQGASSSLSTTTAMSYLNQVINTERGLLYQDGTGVIQFRNRQYVYTNSASITSNATFGYASGQLHYYSTSFVPANDDIDTWNNIPVQRANGGIQTASDSTSQTAHGRRTLTGYTNLLFTNDVDSLDLAQGLLYQYKEPTTRVRAISMDNLIGAGANLAQMLGRTLLDRITINWRPLDGSSVDFSQQSLIEQITHTVDAANRTWTTNFAVTPIGTESFFILGTSQLGTGILGF